MFRVPWQLGAAGAAVCSMVLPDMFAGPWLALPLFVLLMNFAHIALLLGFGRSYFPCCMQRPEHFEHSTPVHGNGTTTSATIVDVAMKLTPDSANPTDDI